MMNYSDNKADYAADEDGAALSNEMLSLLSCVLKVDCFSDVRGLDIHRKLRKITALTSSRPRTTRQVVFVSDIPRSREAKLAYGLKENGWDTILLYKENPSFETARYFSQAHQYQTPLDALMLAFNFSPVAFHIFSCWDYQVATAFIIYKPGKIIFDDYDVLAGMVNEAILDDNLRVQFNLERYCLENADGLCCRSLETQYAKRHMGYKYRGKRLFFTDYCWNMTHKFDTEKPSKALLTLASVGNLYINHLEPIEHLDNYHLKVALDLAHWGIRSNMYKTFLTEELVQFVTQASSGSPLINIKYLPYEAMLEELQEKCHAGLICAPPNVTSESNRHFYLQTKRDFAIGNKAFDYIDAEIPVIMDRENHFLFWLINRYQKAFDFDMYKRDRDGHEKQLRAYQNNDNSEQRKAKSALSVVYQAPRLIRFYESL